jgi:hypothetical protein
MKILYGDLLIMAKRVFLRRMEGEKAEDSSKVFFTIYKEGNGTVIIPADTGVPHPLHPSSRSVEEEISMYFDVKNLRTIAP